MSIETTRTTIALLSSAPGVANCVVNYFRGQAFPTPKGGCVDVNIPINFVPRQ